MAVLSHLTMLKHRHERLEAKIHDGFLHHLPDEEIHHMKKVKLDIKEQIDSIEQQSRNETDGNDDMLCA